MTAILDRISTGEDSYTEFKSEDFHNDSLAKEIVAFSNMKGGSIFIGVNDDGTISGVTQEKLTVLGALFFAKELRSLLMQSGVQLFYFEGMDNTGNILDQKEVFSTIPESIESSIRFVEYNSRVRGIFSENNIRRIDIHDFDPFTVRELISNAFCHRDWSILGQKIRIGIFEDRLEIFSPGGLPNTMTLENMLAGISYYRNPIVAQFCKDYVYIEKSGRGIEKIQARAKEQNLPLPVFEINPYFVKVTLMKNKSYT